MLLQILGLAVALSMTANAATAVRLNENARDTAPTSVRLEPKRAYFDPAETYGTTSSTFYNYSSHQVIVGAYWLTDETTLNNTFTGNIIASNQTSSLTSNGGAGESPWTFNLPYTGGSTNTWASDIFDVTFDLYINGVFYDEISMVRMYGPNGFMFQNNYPHSRLESQISYVWLFDHTPTEDEAREAEIGGIFTEVGNVVTGMAETLTKPWDGIVNIFYDTTNNKVTDLGILCLVSLGCAVAIMGFAIAIRLFKQRG